MDTVLGLPLIRFGVIVGGLVALLVFGDAVVLKHRARSTRLAGVKCPWRAP